MKYYRIFALPKGSDGRVARHSSAKAATAVRIRLRPRKRRLTVHCEAALF